MPASDPLWHGYGTGESHEDMDDSEPAQAGWAPYRELSPSDPHPAHSAVGDDGHVLDATQQDFHPVGLRAICGLRERRLENARRSIDCWVGEFVLLSNGRRVILHDDRGFTLGIPNGSFEGLLTVDDVIETVLIVARDGKDEHRDDEAWSSLAASARARGLGAAPELLRSLPYEVVLTESLTQLLG